MFDLIIDENVLSSLSTEELKGFLYALQHENLTRLYYIEDYPQLCSLFGVMNPIVNQVVMGKVIRLEDASIEELHKRGEVPSVKILSGKNGKTIDATIKIA